MQHSNTAGCILLKFYIKPQHTANVYNLLYVVSYRNSTSNHNTLRRFLPAIRVVSYRNSTSNHNSTAIVTITNSVVSYRNSTSNHNKAAGPAGPEGVVSYRNSTSNHNSGVGVNATMSLYLIEILHQTTTLLFLQLLHLCCILSKFYIKPQLPPVFYNLWIVVSYRNSTSNHNPLICWLSPTGLYLIEILHQTTTVTPAFK